MFRAIDLDDFSGNFCLSGKFPLINAVKTALTGKKPHKPVHRSRYIRVCYITNWSQHRAPPANFTPRVIGPFLCTHIVYSFAKIKNGTLSTHNQNDEAMYKEVMDLKKKNPYLKILLGVGGWNHESGVISPFSVMVRTFKSRKRFIDNSLIFLRKYNFDGLDLDWVYPTKRKNSPPGDKQRYTALCKELSEAFTNESSVTNKPRLLLTAAVAASGKYMIISSYAIRQFVKYLDLLHLMTFDLHGSWESRTGHHTSMQISDPLSVIRGLNVWINGGIPRRKIVLGFATYGRSFTLAKNTIRGLRAPSIGAGEKGKYVKLDGIAAYYEICEKIKNGMMVNSYNVAKAPYGYQGTYWVGYDNELSLQYKVNTLIKGEILFI